MKRKRKRDEKKKREEKKKNEMKRKRKRNSDKEREARKKEGRDMKLTKKVVVCFPFIQKYCTLQDGEKETERRNEDRDQKKKDERSSGVLPSCPTNKRII